MSTLSTSSGDIDAMKRAAHALCEMGYALVPVESGGKRPLLPWKDLMSDHRAIDKWFERFGGINVAIHAGRSGVVGLDADSAEAAQWIEEHCPATPMRASTPRGGMHAYYRAPEDVPPPAVNLFDIGLDVKSGMSLLLASPSWSDEHGRGWNWAGSVASPGELPVIRSALIRREPFSKPIVEDDGHGAKPRSGGPIRDVTRWIMEVESIQGSGGSNGCFKVACRLVDAGLPWDEAWRWLCRWNESGQAIPPWSEAELSHKLRDAFART